MYYKITDVGQRYTTYYDWVEKYSPRNYDKYMNWHRELKVGDVGKLIKMAPHDLPMYGTLCLLDVEGQICLFNLKGLEEI